MQLEKPVSTVSGFSGGNQDGQVPLGPQGSDVGSKEQGTPTGAGSLGSINYKPVLVDEAGNQAPELDGDYNSPESEESQKETERGFESGSEESEPSESVPTHRNIDEHVEQMQFWLDDSAEDLRNLLLVLIADPCSKPHEPHNFDAETLESTHGLATKYNHSNLRDWAVQQLDHLKITKTMEALSTRDEPITEEEASALGYAQLLKIVAQREKIQYEKGRRAGMSQSPSHGENTAGSIAVSKTTLPTGSLPALPTFSLPSPRALQTDLPLSP